MTEAAVSDGGPASWATTCAKMQGVSSEGTEITWQNRGRFRRCRAGQSVNYEGVTGPVALDEFGNLSEGFIELWTVGDEGIVSDSRVQF